MVLAHVDIHIHRMNLNFCLLNAQKSAQNGLELKQWNSHRKTGVNRHDYGFLHMTPEVKVLEENKWTDWTSSKLRTCVSKGTIKKVMLQRDVLREQHRNMYIIKGETDHQPRLDAWGKCSGLVHWEDPEESGGEGGGRRDRDGEYM